MMGRPTGYCFCILGRRHGPWRETELEARSDAMDAGHASLDECSETIYLDACAEIWVTYGDIIVEARDAAPLAAPSPYPSRIERIIARREGQRAA